MKLVPGYIHFLVFLVLPALPSFAQVVESKITLIPCTSRILLDTLAVDPWKITVNSGEREINKLDEETQKAKEEITKRKLEALGNKYKTNATEEINGIDTPEMRKNFSGINSAAVPFDNGTAVSNGLYIVHSVNSSIAMKDTNGVTLKSYPLYTFFGVGNTISDPRVIYDSYADRFIVVAIPVNFCAVFIAFSQTNDPTGVWNRYTIAIPGEITDNIYDYPYVGISEHELVISGSVFPASGSGGSVHPHILQLSKSDGYTAKTLRMKNYRLGTTNNYSLCVVNHAGPEFAYGNKMYLLSSNRGGSSSNRYYLYTISDTIGGNPQLTSKTFTSSRTYTPPGNAPQYKSSYLLSTNDCRVLSAVYANGTIFAVNHGDAGTAGYAAIMYHRINTVASTISTYTFSKPQTDLCYPSLAMFCKPGNITDPTVIIGFQEVSTTKHPGLSAIINKADGSWTQPIEVKAGGGTITTGRWGDYSSCTRKHNAVVPTAWMSGEYGATGNTRSCWIAEVSFTPNPGDINNPPVVVKSPFAVFPNPVENFFTVEFKLPVEQFIKVSIFDALGQEVKVLFDGALPLGDTQLTFDNSLLAAGSYIVRISDPYKVLHTQKLIVR